MTGRAVGVALAVALVLAGACARPGSEVADGGGGPDEPLPPSVAASPTASTASAVPTPSAVPTVDPDRPPNHVDNNAWKRRADLTAEDREAAEDAAARIRAELEFQYATADITPAKTRTSLLGLGFPAESVQVAGMDDLTYPGAAFGVRVGPRGCVIGSVRPEGVRLEVTGSAAEFGCLEPFSH